MDSPLDGTAPQGSSRSGRAETQAGARSVTFPLSCSLGALPLSPRRLHSSRFLCFLCATELAHSRCLRESFLWSLALWRALCCCWWWAGPVSPPCPGTFARCFPLCYGVHPCVDPLISFIFRAASLLAPSCSGVLPLSGCASQSKSGLQSLSTSGRSVGSSNHCLAFSEVTWVRSRC